MMKKTALCLLALVSVSLGTLAQKTTTKKPAAGKPAASTPLFKNAVDSFSYAAGYNIALSMKQQGVPSVNTALMTKAIEDVYFNRTPSFTEEQNNMTLQDKLQEFVQTKMAAEKAKGAAFLATNKTKPGIIVLPNGLQYQVLTAGETGGQKPAPSDTVVVHYKGTLIDGIQFDASYDRGVPATFKLNEVIPGWTEILQQMTRGAKWKVFIPSELGYGERGNGPKIGPNQALIFDIELLDIKPSIKQ